MLDYVRLFDKDPNTEAIVIFGELGTRNEQEVAVALQSGEIRKPVIALIAGEFQEHYGKGMSFGHIAAMINDEHDTASAKRVLLASSGAMVIDSLEELASACRRALLH